VGARFSSSRHVVVVHLWGFLHPLWRSLVYGWHSQSHCGLCGRFRSLIRLASFMRFFTILTLCVFFKQASFVPW
jgi:hypothetical protein